MLEVIPSPSNLADSRDELREYSRLGTISRLLIIYRTTDNKRVCRYLCGETAQKPTSGPEQFFDTPNHPSLLDEHFQIMENPALTLRG